MYNIQVTNFVQEAKMLKYLIGALALAGAFISLGGAPRFDQLSVHQTVIQSSGFMVVVICIIGYAIIKSIEESK